MRNSSRTASLGLMLALATTYVNAQQKTSALEVNFIKDIRRTASQTYQTELRNAVAWATFLADHPRWRVEFNESSGMPHRAYGPGIATTGATAEDRVTNFIAAALEPMGVAAEELVALPMLKGGKNVFAHFDQVHNGIAIITGHVMVKLDAQQRVISFAAETFDVSAVDPMPTTSVTAAGVVAATGVPNVLSIDMAGLKYLPIPDERKVDVRLVYEVIVNAQLVNRPARYMCWVDAHTGELLYRKDQVVNEHGGNDDAGADVQVNGSVYVNGPLQPIEVRGLPNLSVTINGVEDHTDDDGFLPSGVAGPVQGSLALKGLWSVVRTGGVTPALQNTLNEGANTVNFDPEADERQRTAYWGVNQIHEHAINVLPGFTGMDFDLPTNIDDPNDNCNAYYDGSSINFYAQGGGCRSLAVVPDVIYHEYGHGINDKYYQVNGSNFSNGAMNEGYADVWALTLSLDPILAEGYMLADPNSNIRRYDIDPKVYPVDITGGVHADGEIIAGAWWDTYVLLGNDMPLTISLFSAAFPGLQAAAFNGNEGPAFRDVLIDVLQADDDDSDITNGTPNGSAIVEAFGIHGISLLSNITFQHTPVLAADGNTAIDINANVAITFPDDQYLSGVRAFYRLNNATTWNSILMTNTSGNNYGAQIPAQPAGTVVAYYLALEDIDQTLSSIEPLGAAQADPNLPFFILVDLQLEKSEDNDDLQEVGNFVLGVPGDNATTGLWEQNEPIGSFGTPGDPSTAVAPNAQHTPNGAFCWITGNSSSTTAAIGENDVDGGSTTIMTPVMDLTPFSDPVIAYWRWYTNNPPSGANPNADWWQVYISNNGGTNWVRIEDTKTSDRRWRRNAFRVSDHVSITANMRMKWIASDSLHIGQDLDGGSLVEAGLDDFQIWDIATNIGVIEIDNDLQLLVYPDPASTELNISFERGTRTNIGLEVLDMAGRVVLAPRTLAAAKQQIAIDGLQEGQYMVRLRWNDGAANRAAVRRFSVVH